MNCPRASSAAPYRRMPPLGLLGLGHPSLALVKRMVSAATPRRFRQGADGQRRSCRILEPAVVRNQSTPRIVAWRTTRWLLNRQGRGALFAGGLAILASTCCLGPLVLITLGFSGGGSPT